MNLRLGTAFYLVLHGSGEVAIRRTTDDTLAGVTSKVTSDQLRAAADEMDRQDGRS